MNDCIFCKIANEEIPSVKICEDENHIAILDKIPNTKGMTLLLTKQHFDSDATDMPEKEYSELMIAAKKTAKLLEVEPSQCIVIEDSISGVKSAKAAGMKCIAVTNSFSKDELNEADIVIDSLENFDFGLLGDE